MTKIMSSPADLPRRTDQSLAEHEALVKKIRQVEKMPQDQVDKIRLDARQNLMSSLTNQWDDMWPENKATLAAITKHHRQAEDSGRAKISQTLDGPDAALGRLARQFALGEEADKLDGARLVTGHRAALAREAARIGKKPPSKKKFRVDPLEM